MYIKLNERIERIFKLLHFLFVEMSIVGVVLPAALITIVNYFVYNLGDESWFLPCPAMYVYVTLTVKLICFTCCFNKIFGVMLGCHSTGRRRSAIALL